MPTSYLSEVAPWPSSEPTASDLLRWLAGQALVANAVSQVFSQAYFDQGTVDMTTAVGRRYMANTRLLIALHDIYVLLDAMASRDRAEADRLAAGIWIAAEAGDSYGELAWEWAEKAGLDAQRVNDEAVVRAVSVVAEEA